MSGGLVPPSTLKRPRTDPPSPSSSSSPKRAASEDPVLALDSAGSLPPSANPALLQPSSPLGRMDCDDESAGWVSRTERVTLSESGDAEQQQAPDAPLQSPRGTDASSAGAASGVSDSRKLYDTVMAALPPPFPSGSTFYLLPKPFFSDLQRLAFEDETRPALDLSSLTDPQSAREVFQFVPGAPQAQPPQQVKLWRLRGGLEEDVDFVFIGSQAWDAIVAWADYPPSQPSLGRLCLPGDRIELAPNVFFLHVVAPPNSSAPAGAPIMFTMPRTTSLKTLRGFAASLVADKFPMLAGKTTRLWTLDGDAPSTVQISPADVVSLKGKLLKGEDVTLEDVGVADGDPIVLEISITSGNNVQYQVQQLDGKAIEKSASPLFSKPAFYSGNGAATASSNNSLLSIGGPQTRSQTRGRHPVRGLVGLNNLGNTCFLASATQCLSNTTVLADYFLAGVYRDELNPDNPLGMHGQVAEAFGELIENLHTQSAHSSVSPRRLKATCGRFAPQFVGYGQHDTQEFLAFLLDGLHEDLNRIKKKPYIEKPDWKPGGGDKELAELGKECWEGYKKRNDSVIVDLFQGQLQSTLVCPECKKESITMDPFMYLTIPLPISQTRTYSVIYFPADTTKAPLKVNILVPTNASFSSVKDMLGGLVGASGNQIVGLDQWKNNVYGWWLDSDPNSEAKETDVSVFHELGVPVVANHKTVGTAPTDGSITLPVYTFVTYDQPRSSFQRDIVPNDCHLEPFFIRLSQTEACDPAAVRAAIMRGYSRLLRPGMAESLFVPANSPHAKIQDEEAEEPVAEIHISRPASDVGDAAEGADAEDGADEGSLTPSGLNPPQGTTISRNPSSTSLSADSAQLVARVDLFKVHVADATSAESNASSGSFFGKSAMNPAIHSLYRGTPQRASPSWSLLDNRADKKRPMMQRLSSSISSLVGSNAPSDEEVVDPDAPLAAPVVRPGEGIYVEWSPDEFEKHFERDRPSLLNHLDLVIDPAIAKDAAKKRDTRGITLEDCLDEFSKEETLGQDDLWYCPVCKKHQAATKKLDIYKAPDILVICLKRFGSSRQLRDKLDHLVNFPIDGLDLDERIGERRITKSLDLSDEMAHHYGIEHSTEPFIYDLYAVDNHFGGLGGGHYTAFCRNEDDNHWYNYDDSRVSKTSANSVQSRAAYLLFYRRRTERRIGGISRVKAEEASRAVTPLPSRPESPAIGPSVPASALGSSRSSVADTPLEPSPVISSESGDEEDMTITPFPITAQSIGYGNTAWGRTAQPEGVTHSFHAGMLTPDSSDAGDDGADADSEASPMNLTASGRGATLAPAATGLSDAFQAARTGDDEASDAEMMSMPRSPRSEVE